MHAEVTSSSSVAFRGGGILVAAGSVALSNYTVIRDNSARLAGTENLDIFAGSATYAYPILPGHWIPASPCRVTREACGLCASVLSQNRNGANCACLASYDACGLIQDDMNGNTSSVPSSLCQRVGTALGSDCSNPQPCTNWDGTQALALPPLA